MRRSRHRYCSVPFRCVAWKVYVSVEEQPCRSSVAAVPPDEPEHAATLPMSPGAPAGSVSVKTRKSLPPAPSEFSGVRTPAALSSALTDAVAAPLTLTTVAPGVQT
jgi:hypothetical protein